MSKTDILRNAYRKIDGMALSFGLPAYSDTMPDDLIEKHIGGDLNDTLRELRLKDCNSVESMSQFELNVENRTVYYAIRRFRHSASVFFKFSTAVDGKTIDKSMIPKMLSEILKEYDDEFKKWRRTFSGSGTTWTRETDVVTSGEIGSDS